jgi:hypothetical protein
MREWVDRVQDFLGPDEGDHMGIKWTSVELKNFEHLTAVQVMVNLRLPIMFVGLKLGNGIYLIKYVIQSDEEAFHAINIDQFAADAHDKLRLDSTYTHKRITNNDNEITQIVFSTHTGAEKDCESAGAMCEVFPEFVFTGDLNGIIKRWNFSTLEHQVTYDCFSGVGILFFGITSNNWLVSCHLDRKLRKIAVNGSNLGQPTEHV